MDFEAYLVEQDFSTRTVLGYLGDFRLFEKWFNERHDRPLMPTELTPTDIRDYRAWLIKCEMKPPTINRALAAIRAWGEFGVYTKQIDANPAAGLHGIRQQNKKLKWLDRKQQAKLIREVERDLAVARTHPAIAKAKRNMAIITLLLHTGLRVGELCALRMNAVELGERSGKVTVMGKGSKVREIPLNSTVRAALKAWIDGRPRVFMFPGQIETLTPQTVGAMLSEYGRRAEVPVSPHILRHTFAKNLIDAGVSIEQVAELMGHAKLETTRIYTLPGEQDLQRAVEKLDL
jgi:integrase/recombinase XerC